MDVQTLARPEAKDGQGGSITLPVAGMTCASCVGSVEKAVGKVPGVRTVSVNLATGRAEKRVVPKGDDRPLRQVSSFCLACDHRAVDGSYAAAFLEDLKELMENLVDTPDFR